MKIAINKSSLQDFREKNLPATITLSKSNIAFNNVARKLLVLKKGIQFEFEIDDSKIFYKESIVGGFEITNENEKMLSLACSQIGPYIADLMKIKATTLKFKVGEFKAGRWELNLV